MIRVLFGNGKSSAIEALEVNTFCRLFSRRGALLPLS